MVKTVTRESSEVAKSIYLIWHALRKSYQDQPGVQVWMERWVISMKIFWWERRSTEQGGQETWVRCSLGRHPSPRWASGPSAVKRAGDDLQGPSFPFLGSMIWLVRVVHKWRFLVEHQWSEGHIPWGIPGPYPKRRETIIKQKTELFQRDAWLPMSNPNEVLILLTKLPGLFNKQQCTLKALDWEKSSGDGG